MSHSHGRPAERRQGSRACAPLARPARSRLRGTLGDRASLPRCAGRWPQTLFWVQASARAQSRSTGGGEPAAREALHGPAPLLWPRSSLSSEVLAERVWNRAAHPVPRSRGRRGSQRTAWPSPWSQLAGRAGLPPGLTPGTKAKAVAGLIAVLLRAVLGAVWAQGEELLRAPHFSSHTLSAAGRQPGSAAASAGGPRGASGPRATSRVHSSPGLYGSLPFLYNSEKKLQKAERKASSF